MPLLRSCRASESTLRLSRWQSVLHLLQSQNEFFVVLSDMALDQNVNATQPLQIEEYNVSESEQHVANRLQLLSTQHKVTAYSLACTDNPEYFCYQSASLQILHYAQFGKLLSIIHSVSFHVACKPS